MFAKTILCWFLFLQLSVCPALPIADSPRQTPQTQTLASENITQWSGGLLVVLGLFFICAWGVRKLSGMNHKSADKMRIIGGLSLGMREKVILLQVGKKQLILGVTPSRIQTLHVLEGDDCLAREDMSAKPVESAFVQKLMQAIKAHPDA